MSNKEIDFDSDEQPDWDDLSKGGSDPAAENADKSVHHAVPVDQFEQFGIKSENIEPKKEGKRADTKPAARKEIIVRVNRLGDYEFRNQMELGQAASMIITEGTAKHLFDQGGKAAVMAGLQLCKHHGLTQDALGQMTFIKGRLSVYGDLYTALAQKDPKWRPFRTFYIDEDCERICVKNKNVKNRAYANVIQILHEGEEKWAEDNFNEYIFTMDDADEAGLLNPTTRSGKKNTDSPWIKYIKDMLFHKNKKRAFGKEYAAGLNGIQMYEDIKEVHELRDVTPRGGKTNAEIMNEAFEEEGA
jgi:hypothetical protein